MATLPLHVVTLSAPADYSCYRELAQHLKTLQHQGLISLWHDSQMLPGSDMKQERNRHLDASTLILVLLSSDFLYSNDCQEQLTHAIQRRATASVPVVPIILRPVDLSHSPLAGLKTLPQGGLPILQWRNKDEAYRKTAEEIHALIRELISR